MIIKRQYPSAITLVEQAKSRIYILVCCFHNLVEASHNLDQTNTQRGEMEMARSEEIFMMGGPIILEEIPTNKETEKCCDADRESLELLRYTGRGFIYRHAKKDPIRRGKDDEFQGLH